jgi:predicted RNA binding protein YcfA (HicA-like mRNA interferase family)
LKRVDLIRQLEECGCILLRRGGRHDWYQNSKTGACQPIPRHREINEHLARHILRKLEVS